MIVFLGALVACAAVAVNPWPFSDWELFSRLRVDRQTRWEEVAVGSTGRTRELVVARPPKGYAPARLGTACAAWLRLGAGRLGGRPRLLKVYYVTWLLTARRGEHAAPPHRRLELTCRARGTS